MNEGLRLLIVIGVTCAAFLYVGYSVPQIESGPVEVETEIGESPEELISAGKRIVESDRAQCLTCHSMGEDPKARCPDLQVVGAIAASRRPGQDGPEYVIESLYHPNAFVVSGYPKNQMNPVNRPPIALSHDEVLAVACYLLNLGEELDEEAIGRVRDVQEPWRTGERTPDEVVEEEVGIPILSGDPRRGERTFFSRGCAACHRLGDVGEEIGPDLSTIGAAQTPEYILESILDPRAVIVKGYEDAEQPMTLDFADQMSPREVFDLIAFLSGQKGDR